MPWRQTTPVYCVAILFALFGVGCSEKAKPSPPKPPEVREPVDPIKELFFQYCAATNKEARTPARLALQESSSNSVPFLVNTAINADQVTQWFLKHRPPLDIDVTNIRIHADTLASAFHPSAKLLLPLLTNLMSDSNETNRAGAFYFMGRIGEGSEQALPYLEDALTNSASGEMTRSFAAQSLWLLGSNALPALPAIIEGLKQPGTTRRLYSALGNLGVAAEPALPTLVEHWTSTGKTNDYLYEVICKIDTNRMAKLVRDLVKKTKGTNVDVLNPAITKLLNISRDDALAVLRDKMHKKPASLAMWAARRLLRTVPDDLETFLFLQYYLEDPRHHSEWDEYNIKSLELIPATNQQAIAILERYAQDTREEVRKAAEESLAEIRGKSLEK